MNLEFKEGCVNTIRWWFYRFLRHHKLALRGPTRVSHRTPAESEAVRESFAQSTMKYIQMNCIPRCLFVNIDETAIYFDTTHNTTVHVRGAKLFHTGVEAVAPRDARFASLLLLMEPNFLYLLFSRLDRMERLQRTCIKFCQMVCMDACRRTVG